MRLLFWVATAQEWRAACPAWSGPLPEHELLELSGGHGHRHALCITGVGPVNAALAAGLCLGALRHGASPTAGFAVDAAVNLGVAGSFDLARAPLGSAWRVTREIWPEYGLACDTGVDARALGFAQWQQGETPEQAVWDSVDVPHAAEAFGKLPGPLHALPTAASLTVAGVTADAARAARLHSRYGALLENMEGFALALACARHDLPLLELRTVSNAVGPRRSRAGVQQQNDFPKALAALQPLLRNLLNLAEHG